MSDIDPQHIDAVARAAGESVVWGGEGVWERYGAILDSTDPAVHAAMLDALTRHGVLTEVWRWRNENVGGLYGCPPVSCEVTSRAHLTEYGDDTIERRLVTVWEVTP